MQSRNPLWSGSIGDGFRFLGPRVQIPLVPHSISFFFSKIIQGTLDLEKRVEEQNRFWRMESNGNRSTTSIQNFPIPPCALAEPELPRPPCTREEQVVTLRVCASRWTEVLGEIGLQPTQQTKMTSVLKITVVLVICFTSVEYRKDKVFCVICEKGVKANRSQIPS